MIFPIGDDNPREKTPFVNYALMGANIIVFLVLGFRGDYDRILDQYGVTPAHLQLHTILTSMFLHANVLHLASNMLYLWIMGDNVEDRLGRVAYLFSYLACGLAADLMYCAVHSESLDSAVGASGAIFGVLAMYVIFFPHNRINFAYFFFYRAGTFAMSALWAVAIWFAMEFLYGYMQLYYESFSYVAHWAHIGGLLLGSGIGLVVRFGPQLLWQSRPEPDVPQRTDDPTAGQIEEGVRELKRLIRSKLIQGYTDRALKLYETLASVCPEEPLDPILQLRIAKAYQKREQPADAAKCLEKYLVDHPADAKRAEVKLALGVLYSRELSRPDRARQRLAEAARELKSAKRAARAQRELASIMAGVKGPAGAPEARFTVMCAADEPMDILLVGKLVAKETKTPQFEVARRIREHSGFLARNLTLMTAQRVAAVLQNNGVRAVVIDETEIVELPDAERVAAMSSAGASDTVTFQILDASLTKRWSDIYLVTCGWIEQIPMSPSSMSDELVYGPMMTGTFMGMGVSEFLERKREIMQSLQSPRTQEPRLFIDFFFRDFREHLRIETDMFDYGSLGVQSSPDSRASVRALSRIIVERLDAACVTTGLLSIARGVPRPEKHLIFASELSFDEYNSWRIELKRRSS